MRVSPQPSPPELNAGHRCERNGHAMSHRAIFLPGSVLPAEPAYGALLTALWDEYKRLEGLPPDQFMSAFARANLKPGVSPPPPSVGEAPPWMAKRPAGIRAFMDTFESYDLDHEALRRFHRPVYYALGGLSNPDQFGEIAKRLGTV